MPDKDDNELADEAPATPLHAHDDGRDEDVKGDPEPEVREDGDRDEEGPGNPVNEEE